MLVITMPHNNGTSFGGSVPQDLLAHTVPLLKMGDGTLTHLTPGMFGHVSAADQRRQIWTEHKTLKSPLLRIT
eukprot:8925355-Pyramimonas_sp.AAC.2